MNKKYEVAVNLPQDFTVEEQSQGRNNIGAVSAADVEIAILSYKDIEANTLRFSFSKKDYDPTVAGAGSSGTWKKLITKAANVWDWTKSGTSFAEAFLDAFTDSDNIVSVITAGDTSAVTNMYRMFADCTSLTSVPLLDTSAVTSIRAMFLNCASLASVPLFNTSAVTDMSYMFQNCTSLTSVPLLNTSAVTDMTAMFLGCTSLTSVPLFNTPAVTNMYRIFQDCTSLASVPLFNTSAVTSMNRMFLNCASLASVPLFNTSAVTDMTYMFQNCTSLTSVPLLDTSAVTDMSYMFLGCSKVEGGALALYQQASTQSTPPSSHSSTFTNCGKDTVTGAAELAQIPASWGGTAP